MSNFDFYRMVYILSTKKSISPLCIRPSFIFKNMRTAGAYS